MIINVQKVDKSYKVGQMWSREFYITRGSMTFTVIIVVVAIQWWL